MAKKSKQVLIAELKAAGIEVDESMSDQKVREIANLSRLSDEDTKKPEVVEEVKVVKTYIPKVVRCGVADIQDIENRLCAIEKELGL